MPELPEVEVLVRRLQPLLAGKTIRNVEVGWPNALAPLTERDFANALRGSTFLEVSRRGKYLLFKLRPARGRETRLLIGHLGMTGRMYLQKTEAPLPKHVAAAMDLGSDRFIFEDTRRFGRLTLDARVLEKLGPEPLESDFNPEYLVSSLKNSRQAIKVRLLDQTLVAGVGNIYASEALFRARISPRTAANRLDAGQVRRLCRAVREVLRAAVRKGSTLPIDIAGTVARDGLFYFGAETGATGPYTERLLVYDRFGLPCVNCGTAIKRLVQAARSTYFCPECQQSGRTRGKIS